METIGKRNYKEKDSIVDRAADSVVSYGDINAIKVQLVNRIMCMDDSKDALSVLDFVKSRNQLADESEFDKEWNRSLSVEDFCIQYKNKLKKVYARNGN